MNERKMREDVRDWLPSYVANHGDRGKEWYI